MLINSFLEGLTVFIFEDIIIRLIWYIFQEYRYRVGHLYIYNIYEYGHLLKLFDLWKQEFFPWLKSVIWYSLVVLKQSYGLSVACQAPLTMGFSRQEYWSGLSFPSPASQPRDWTWVSHIAGRCFTLWATREANQDPFVELKKNTFAWAPSQIY